MFVNRSVKYFQISLIVLLGVLHFSVQVYHQNEITTKPPNDLDKNWYPKHPNTADGIPKSDQPSIRNLLSVMMHHNYSRIALQRSDPNFNPPTTPKTHIQKIPRKPKNKDDEEEKLSVLPLSANAKQNSDEAETNSYRPDTPPQEFFGQFPEDDDTQQRQVEEDDDQQKLVDQVETFDENQKEDLEQTQQEAFDEDLGQTQQEVFDDNWDQKQQGIFDADLDQTQQEIFDKNIDQTVTAKPTTSTPQYSYHPVYNPIPSRQPVYVDPKLLNRTISAHSHVYQPNFSRRTTPRTPSESGYPYENPYQTDDTQQVGQELHPTYLQLPTGSRTQQLPGWTWNQQTNTYNNAHSYQTSTSQQAEQQFYHTFQYTATPEYYLILNQQSGTSGNTYPHQTSDSQLASQQFYPAYQKPVTTTPSQQVRGHYLTYIPNPVTLPTTFQQPAYINPGFINKNVYVHSYSPSESVNTHQSQEVRGYLNCPPKATGQFPYALDCKQFLNCWKGRGFIQNCGPGTVFNPKTQECDFPDKVQCVAYKSQADAFDSVRYPKSYLGKNRNELGEEHSEHLETQQQTGITTDTVEERIFCPRDFIGFNPHPVFCNKYINCSQSGVTVEQCMLGMHFNPVTSNCDFPQFVNCENKRLAKFSEQNAQKNLEFVSHTFSKTSSSSLSEATKPTGTVYVEQSPAVVVTGSLTKEVQCPIGAVGLVPHPYDCKSYLNCASGRAVVQQCGPGTMFNPKISACDFPGNVNCQQHPSRQGKENANIEYPPEVTIQDAKCPDDVTGLLPHPYDCKQYLNCANGRTFIQPCGPGTVFNPKISACDFPSNVPSCQDATPSIDIRTMPIPNTADAPLGKQIEKQTRTGLGFDHIYGQGSENVETIAVNKKSEQIDYQHKHFWNQGNVENQGNLYHGNTQKQTTDQQESSGSFDQTHFHQQHDRNHGFGFTSQNQWRGQTTEEFQKFWNQAQKENDDDNQQHVVDGQDENSHDRNKNVETFNPLVQPNFHHNHPGNFGPFIHTHAYHSRYNHSHIPQGQQHVVDDQDENFHDRNKNVETFNPLAQPNFHHNHPGNFGPFNHTHAYHSRHNHSHIPQGQWRPMFPTPPHNHHHYHHRGARPQFHHYHHHHPNGTFPWQPRPSESTTPTPTVNEDVEFVIDQRQRSDRDSKDLDTAGTSNFGPTFFNRPEQTTPQTFLGEDDSFFKPVFTESPRSQEKKPSTTPYATPKPIPQFIPPKSRDTWQETSFTNPNVLVPSRFDHAKTTTPIPPKTPQKSSCLPSKFECAPDICLSLQYVCDGFPHCPNGADESNCTRYVINFIEHKNLRMMGHDVQKWTTDLDTCAKYCMSSKSFVCKSFSYRKSDKLCILNDKVAGETGSMRTFNEFTYYESKDHTMSCKDQYKCDNLKCINLNDICNSVDNCGDNSDEKYCTEEHLNFAVRLVGSKNVNEGRLEVRAFGRWGAVCDDKFNLRDANVACQELGFPLGAVQVQHNPYYYAETNNVHEPKNTTLILMDEVECLGNETSLKDCQFNGWGVHDCKPEEVVGLVCKTKSVSCPEGYWLCQKSMECIPLAFLCDHVNDCDDSTDEMPNICEAKLEFRLVNGSTPLEGRVEVRHFGVWGTVCDDDFDDNAAKVICKHMGYYGPARALKGGMFGPGTGPIWLDQLNCAGNESSVDKCLHNEWGKNNCEHAEDAAVVCSRTAESPLKKAPGTYGTPRKIEKQLTLEDVLPKVCGIRDEATFSPSNGVAFRVVAGSVAEKGHYPWQASLRVRGQSKMSHWCGAVVITPIHVLTAAHCLVGFSKSSYVVRAGDYESEVDEGTEEEAYIEEFYIHEQFRKGHHMNNDIALIKLKGRGFNLGKHIQAICLPDQQTQYTHGKNCTISGWGSTASGKLSAALQLRAGWIPIQSVNICKQPQVYGKAIQDGMFCAGNLDEGVDACDGDSGGPLACLDNGLFTLYGITSWGQHCGYANKPGVYVKVGYYRDWIDETIKKSLK